MIRLIFEGVEDNISLEEFKEDYKTSESFYNDIKVVKDNGNGKVEFIYNNGETREFKKYVMSSNLDLVKGIDDTKQIINGDELEEKFFDFEGGKEYTIKVNCEEVTFNNWAKSGIFLELYKEKCDDYENYDEEVIRKTVYTINLSQFPFEVDEENGTLYINYDDSCFEVEHYFVDHEDEYSFDKEIDC